MGLSVTVDTLIHTGEATLLHLEDREEHQPPALTDLNPVIRCSSA